jgi:hypothetical protein
VCDVVGLGRPILRTTQAIWCRPGLQRHQKAQNTFARVFFNNTLPVSRRHAHGHGWMKLVAVSTCFKSEQGVYQVSTTCSHPLAPTAIMGLAVKTNNLLDHG